MPTPRPTRPIDPVALDAPARDRLADRLFSVHQQVFERPHREEFRAYVLESAAKRTRLQVYTDPGGSTIGYFAFHTFHLALDDGEPLAVHRAETGLLGAFRGGAACDRFLAQQFLAALVRSPDRTHLFFACLTHPSSYCGLSRHLPQIWPRPDHPLPQPVHQRLVGLADAFGLERVPGTGELVRRVGWVTRDAGHQQSRWDTSTDPRAQMYRRLNPTYRNGTGLLTMIPMSLAEVGSGLTASMVHKASRSIRRMATVSLTAPQTRVATGA